MFYNIKSPSFWAIKCATTKAANTKGNKKCNEKNLFNVAFETLKPPQINCTKSWPKTGIADNKLVITVAKFKINVLYL